MISLRIAPDMRMAIVGSPSYFKNWWYPRRHQSSAAFAIVVEALRYRGVPSVSIFARIECFGLDSPVSEAVRFWRNPRLQPRSAFSRFPPVHKAELEGQLRGRCCPFLK
jgi:hypothetical protein